MILRLLSLSTLALALAASVATASTQQDLDRAAQHGEAAFILVTDEGAAGIDQARETIAQAMQRVEK